MSQAAQGRGGSRLRQREVLVMSTRPSKINFRTLPSRPAGRKGAACLQQAGTGFILGTIPGFITIDYIA